MSAVVAGSTGLVGSQILATVLAHPSFSSVSAFARRKLPAESPKLISLEAKDSETWPSLYPKGLSVFFSALGTTRAAAGSVEAQRKIDVDLNLALAKAAREAGADTYVLISSAGASSKSGMAYPKMKGDLEDAVKTIGFKHTVILRPGVLVGNREDSRPAEFALRKVAGFFGAISCRLKDFWAQDSDVIARAAVHASLECLNGNKADGVWEISQAEIVKLGRTEWKAPETT
ncbi:hypothetical protein FKW77_005824 [Venturia effusa]|uniref:NAD(P)-binding domain-containing protein n=1 Tax=Venturia effusa TaxID=50376 RepID=A0A517LDZ0_9PEZI|nr:hypothetical protein FKW77_005824 [Venturia effusa]